MALVSYIIGACPSCGTPESYGNVMVGGNTLSRGCLHCKHWDRIPLPELRKKVIYLDQFFFSHAFRGKHRMFVEAQKRITNLALAQQIVAPYSNLHEDESQLWTEAQRAPLLNFIKQTSLGHKFSYEYEVKDRQIHYRGVGCPPPPGGGLEESGTSEKGPLCRLRSTLYGR